MEKPTIIVNRSLFLGKFYIAFAFQVVDCHLVKDPHTKESRGFGFVTMETNDDAECCIKYLNRSVFEGRLITVEKVIFSS